MGAYENPTIAVDDKSALILAQGFQNFGSTITKAFLEQQKKEEELAKQDLVDKDNLLKASQLSAKQMQNFIDKNLEKLGDVGDKLVEQTRGSLMREAELDAQIQGMAVRTNEDLETKKKLQEEYNALQKANRSRLSDYEDFDNITKTLAFESSQGYLTRQPGQIDNLDPRNQAAIKVSNILSGITEIDQPFTEKTNSLGENIMVFYPKGEEPFEYNISKAEQSTYKVSEMTSRLDKTLKDPANDIMVTTKDGIKPSDKFLIFEEVDGQKVPKYKYSEKTLPDGTTRMYRTPEYDMEGFRTALIGVATTSNNEEQDDYGRLSAFRHMMQGTMVGKDVTYTGVDGTSKTVKIDKNSFNLNDKGEMSEDQSLLYSAMLSGWTEAKYNFVPQAEEDFTRAPQRSAEPPKPGETPQDKAKRLYDAYKKNPVSYYQEYLGVEPQYDREANTMTVPADEASGREEIVWNMNNPADRNNFYAQIFENSPSGQGTSKEVRVLNEAYADVVRSGSEIRVAKNNWIKNWQSNNPGKSKQDAEAAYKKMKKYSSYIE